MTYPLLQAEKWMQMGKEVVIVTVIDTWQASPNSIGSQMIIDDEGEFVGAVSGGCIESEVLLESKNIIISGEPKRLKYEVCDSTALANGVDGGGQVDLYLERIG